MKKYIYAGLLIFNCSNSFAQLGELKQKQLLSIKQSKTYFVLDDQDSRYNKVLKESAPKFWKLGEYDFIKQSEVANYVKEPNTNFIIKSIFSFNSGSGGNWVKEGNSNGQVQNNFHSNASGLSYQNDGIALVHGDRKNTNFGWNDWLSYALLSNAQDTAAYWFKAGEYIQVIQNFINYVELSGHSNISLSEGKEIYNKKKDVLKEKTLYIRKADMPKGINLLNQVKMAYRNDVKFATDEEIYLAIKNQDEKVAILNSAFTSGRWYPYITSAKGGEVIYLDEYRNYQINPSKTTIKFLATLSED